MKKPASPRNTAPKHTVFTATATCAVLAICTLSTPHATAAPASECRVPVAADTAALSHPPQFLLSTHDARGLADGAGIKVAVIDTGVAAHPRMQVTAVADLVDPGDPDPHLDCDGHGTIVAGIIAGAPSHGDLYAGIAPGAEILSIRQSSAFPPRRSADAPEAGSDEEASGTLTSLAHAIELAVDSKARIINISVTACLPAARADRLNTDELDAALARAESEGAVIVASAGNATPQCTPDSVIYPASSPTVLSVGAVSGEVPHYLTQYSLPGQQLSAAGGVHVGLSPKGEGMATAMAASEALDAPMEPFEGTSFSAPVVSGLAALLLQRRGDLSPAGVREIFHASAQPPHGVLDGRAVADLLPGPPPQHPTQVSFPAALDDRTIDRAGAIGVLGVVLLALGVAIAGIRHRVKKH